MSDTSTTTIIRPEYCSGSYDEMREFAQRYIKPKYLEKLNQPTIIVQEKP